MELRNEGDAFFIISFVEVACHGLALFKIMLIRLEHFRPGCTITPCHGFFQPVRGCDCLIYNGS